MKAAVEEHARASPSMAVRDPTGRNDFTLTLTISSGAVYIAAHAVEVVGVTDHDGVKVRERHWQDTEGGGLQERAYGRPGTRVVLERQFARIADALRLRPHMRVLDLGCGVAQFLVWLGQRRPVTCHGLDLSLTSLQSARRVSRSLYLLAGDAEQTPYRGGSFDRVVCNGAAHHFLDTGASLREMYRILAPGGLLVLHEPTATAITNAIRKVFPGVQRYESPADLAHKEEFTVAAVKTLAARAGFVDVSISLHDFLAYPLSGNYLASPLSRSKAIMRSLVALESALARLPLLTRVFDAVAWRLLLVASKPSS